MTIVTDMGQFVDGEERYGELQFPMTIEAPDNGWGAYGAPTEQDGRNVFIPIPEPHLPLLLGVSLMLVLRRRR